MSTASEREVMALVEQAEQAWLHAEENHSSEIPDNASLRIDYLRAIAAELRALRGQMGRSSSAP